MAYLPGGVSWLTGSEDAVELLRGGAPQEMVITAIRDAERSHLARAAHVAATGRRLRRRLRARISKLVSLCRTRLLAFEALMASSEARELQWAALEEEWGRALALVSRRRRLYVVAAARLAPR